MAIQDLDSFTDQVSIELGSLASKVAGDAFESASDKVYNEVQWSYPITDPFKCYWQTGQRRDL